MELTEIKCPCCEGTVQIKINQKEAKCNYCDTVFLISNIIDQDKKEVSEAKSNEEKTQLIKNASKYNDYYQELHFEFSQLYYSLRNGLLESNGYFDKNIDLPRSGNGKLCNYVSGFAIPIVYYKDVEVNKEKLAPNYYRNQYEEWLKENKDLYTKLFELETKLREVEKKPLSLSKNKSKKITSPKENITFLKEKNSNDFDEKKVTELEESLSVRIDDLKFTKIELLLFSKKKDDSYDIKNQFDRLKGAHLKGKELKKRIKAYDSLSASEIEFLNNWLALCDLVKNYGETLVTYLKSVDRITNSEESLSAANKQLLNKYEEIMDEIKIELDKTELLNIVKTGFNDLMDIKKEKKIS